MKSVEPVVLFLDFDDTLSDYTDLGRQYVAVLAATASIEFGGSAERWIAALQPALVESLARYRMAFTGNPRAGFVRWIAGERERLVKTVCDAVGIGLPRDLSPVELGLRLQSRGLESCTALFPGATAAMREISDAGVAVNLASSQESHYLRSALAGSGVEGYIDNWFGADLVDCAKEGPEFYHCVFAACGIRPSQAIVVDDQPECLDWAEEAGARVIQACIKRPRGEAEFPVVMTDLAELPRMVLE